MNFLRSMMRLGITMPALFPSVDLSSLPVGPRRRRVSKLYTPNGKREVERRLRQIAGGKLRAENGVIT